MSTHTIANWEAAVVAESVGLALTDLIHQAEVWYRVPADVFDWETMAVSRPVAAEQIRGEWIVADGGRPVHGVALAGDFPELDDYVANPPELVRTLVCDDHPDSCPDDLTGKSATPEQIAASDAAAGGLIGIDTRDGAVCAPGSFAQQAAEAAGSLARVWVD